MVFKLENICFGFSRCCFGMGEECFIMSKQRFCFYLLCYILYIFGLLFIYIDYHYNLPGPFVVWIIFSGISIMFGGIGVLHSCGIKIIHENYPQRRTNNPIDILIDNLESRRMLVNRVQQGIVVDDNNDVIVGTVIN